MLMAASPLLFPVLARPESCRGASAALVGSMLDNGDEIISTPQSCSKLVFREGRELPEGFLTVSGSKH